MMAKCPSCPGFQRYRYAPFIRRRHMPTSSIRKEGRKGSSKIVSILIVIHKDLSTITLPCNDWYLLSLSYICTRWDLIGFVYQIHQCKDHFQLRIQTLPSNIAVYSTTGYDAI